MQLTRDAVYRAPPKKYRRGWLYPFVDNPYYFLKPHHPVRQQYKTKRYKSMIFKRILFLLILLVPILSACKSDAQGRRLADELPLDKQRPTFAFFFTDG